MNDGKGATALNGVCPYFTMFPLDFPLGVLREHAAPGEWVLDPFCGRGTTNYAARLLGLPSLGIDSSPVAAALTEAKIANTTPVDIVQAAQEMLASVSSPQYVPSGDFWENAYHADVLPILCRLREGLLRDDLADAEKALRGVLMGALHGPRNKTRLTYFSNQCTRTFAPKPTYAVRFWRQRDLLPPWVDVLQIIEMRADRYYGQEGRSAIGGAILGDSREAAVFDRLVGAASVNWVITSPPYYGMNYYLQDQWLRHWFLGGPEVVSYHTQPQGRQMCHSSPDQFAEQLRQVWQNVGRICRPGAHLVIRYGAIHGRKADPMAILMSSLGKSGWQKIRQTPAGTAARGYRQALHFAAGQKQAQEEWDVWAAWNG